MHFIINKKPYTLSLTPKDYQSLAALGGTIKSLLAYLKSKFDTQEEIVALTINHESINLKDLNAPAGESAQEQFSAPNPPPSPGSSR